MPLIEVLWSHIIFLLVAISAFVNIRYFCSFCCWMILVGSSNRVGTEHLKEWGFEQHKGNTKRKSLISLQFTSKPFIKAAQIESDSIPNLKPLFLFSLFLPMFHRSFLIILQISFSLFQWERKTRTRRKMNEDIPGYQITMRSIKNDKAEKAGREMEQER